MILRFDDLALKYKEYTDIKGKIRRQVASGELTQITRGLYETNPNTDGKYLAASIYGPSYLSFDYALAYYDLIPEAVYKTYTSATFRKGKIKTYTNHFGFFTFRDIPAAVYPLGIVLLEENGYSYQIASPEKAVCDKLYSLSPVANIKELKALLFDDLRIDEDDFWKLDKNDINILAPLYRSTNLKLLLKLVNRSGIHARR